MIKVRGRHPNSNIGRKPTPEKDRFLPRLNKIDGPIHPIHGKCWVLNRARNGTGVGTSRNARMAWRVLVGVIPDGIQILHKCDNPACVRPEHLFLGTISDNMADAITKGRKGGFPNNKHALGHKQAASAKLTKSVKSRKMWNDRRQQGTDGFKLTANQVKEIREKHKRVSYLKNNTAELAEEYGVSRGQICKIVRGAQRKTCL